MALCSYDGGAGDGGSDAANPPSAQSLQHDPATVDAPGVAVTPCYGPSSGPYYFEHGLRRVKPYHFTYNTYCKLRWRGREILDIFGSEFRDRPLAYYQNAMETGQIHINGAPVPSIHTIVNNGDTISHTLHRHEPPVTAEPIGIVHEDDDLIVINKPAGVPVHPAGRYNHNSLVEIMRSERSQESARPPDAAANADSREDRLSAGSHTAANLPTAFAPLPVNRLDRLTSGIMFLAKHRRGAEKLTDQIMNRTVLKEYIARVVGEFPEGEVSCEQPILSISPKLGLNRVRANGKEAKTVFRRLAYYPASGTACEGDDLTLGSEGSNDEQQPESKLPWAKKQGYSIVRCRPVTGRTHQIRVHLQFLGHPISNDPIYCNQKVFGAKLGKGSDAADDDENVIERLMRMGKEEVADAVAYHDEMVEDYNKRKAEKMTGQVCDVCQTPLYSDPGIHELGIYLQREKICLCRRRVGL